MTIRAILFDHDGTLVNSEVIHFQIWRQALENFEAELSEEIYKKYCSGASTQDNLNFFIENFSLQKHHEQLLGHRNILFHDYLNKQALPLLADVEEIFTRTQEMGLRIAIVSGAHKDTVNRTITYYQLESFVETISCANDVVHNKPAPDVYLHALEKLRLDTTQTIAIEDSWTGLSAAVAANIKCIAVPNEYSQKHDLSAATYACTTLEDALDYISRTIDTP